MTTSRPRSAGRRAGCFLFAAASLFSLLMAELSLRLLGHRPLQLQADRTAFWAYDPDLGWRHRPGQRGLFEIGDVRVEVRLNEQGLRDRDYSHERVDGRKRILVVGDSFAWGFGVAQDEVFTERMESALQNVEVINAGVSGYSTDQELLWLRDEGIKYRPDLVILVMSGNDDAMNRRRTAYFVYPKPAFELEEGGALALRNVPVPKPSLARRLAYQGSHRSALFNLSVGRASIALRSWRRQPPENPSAMPRSGIAEPFALTTALVNEIRAVSSASGAQLLIVTTPMYWPSGSAGTYPELLAALRQQDHDILDIEVQPGFVAERMRLPNDGHWNRDGHAFVAARVIEHIELKGLLPVESGR